MLARFLDEAVNVGNLNSISLHSLPLMSRTKRHLESLKKSALTQKDAENLSKGTVISSMKLTDGKFGKVAIFDFGIVYCYSAMKLDSSLGFKTKTQKVIFRNCIRFDPFEDSLDMPLSFVMEQITDLKGKDSKSSSKDAIKIIDKLSTYSDIKSFSKAFIKISQNPDYDYDSKM